MHKQQGSPHSDLTSTLAAKILSLPSENNLTYYYSFPALDERYESRSIPITVSASELFNATDLAIISDLVPDDDTQMTSIKTDFVSSLAEIRRANAIHAEGRTTSWRTLIIILGLGGLVFVLVLAIIWLIQKNNRTHGRVKREAHCLRQEQEANAIELRGLFCAPTAPPSIDISQDLQDSEQRAVKAADEACTRKHQDTLNNARLAVQSLHDRIARLERRFNIVTPEQLQALRTRLLQLDHAGYTI